MSVCRFSSCLSHFTRSPRKLFSSLCTQLELKNPKDNLRTFPHVIDWQCRNITRPIVSHQTLLDRDEGLYLPSAHKRGIHLSRNNGSRESGSSDKQLPKLLYIQNPLVWFSNKLDFRFLRSNWDPHFSEAEFSRGARQAVSKVTELVSLNKFDSLKNLLTKNALLTLRRDVEILWADEVRRNIALKPEDVQLVIPRKLYFRNKTNQKFCDIDTVFIGLKWLENLHWKNPPLLFVDIFGRFHRNYTEGVKPDWIVSSFWVRRFRVLPAKNKE